MKFVFTEKKIQIPDDVKSYAEKKIGKLDKYFKNEAEAFVTFSLIRGRYVAEVTVHGGNMYFRVTESTGDMYASIDSAVATIDRQIQKNKTRLSKKLRQGVFDKGESPVFEQNTFPDTEEEEEFEIVRTKRFLIKPMTPVEAILQMNLLGHEFFIFRNAESSDESIAIVYRRKSGGYGMIEELLEA